MKTISKCLLFIAAGTGFLGCFLSAVAGFDWASGVPLGDAALFAFCICAATFGAWLLIERP